MTTNLFALSLFPYLAFLWFLTRTPETPRVVLAGFYLLLLFVAITIPAGIYADSHYGTSLANIDWLHGSAEVFLTGSNLVVVVGFKQALDRLRSQDTGRESDVSTDPTAD